MVCATWKAQGQEAAIHPTGKPVADQMTPETRQFIANAWKMYELAGKIGNGHVKSAIINHMNVSIRVIAERCREIVQTHNVSRETLLTNPHQPDRINHQPEAMSHATQER